MATPGETAMPCNTCILSVSSVLPQSAAPGTQGARVRSIDRGRPTEQHNIVERLARFALEKALSAFVRGVSRSMSLDTRRSANRNDLFDLFRLGKFVLDEFC